jgi:hypothetical protein
MIRYWLATWMVLWSSTALSGQSFYHHLSKEERKGLVSTYLDVSQRFAVLHDKKRSDYYKKLSQTIEKSLTTITDLEQVGLAEETDHFTPSPLVLENDRYPDSLVLPEDASQACQILLMTYLDGLISGFFPLVHLVIAENFILPDYPVPLNTEQQKDFFYDFFASYPLHSLTIDDIYDVSSLKVVLFDDSHGFITIQSASDIPYILQDWAYWPQFWQHTHYYFFEKIEERWKIIGFDIDTE